MGKIMAQVVKSHIPDERPLVLGGVLLEGAPPVMKAIFGQMGAELGGKHTGLTHEKLFTRS